LAELPQVRAAVVVAREGSAGEKRLVAYVTATEPLAAETMRVHLAEHLPHYMLPAAFVVLEQLPLTPSGKVDRRALPEPDAESHASPRYEAPQGEMESALADVWQSLLKLDRIGRQDNFFELGGHSLLIVQMVERLREQGLHVEVRSVFDQPRLADLAR